MFATAYLIMFITVARVAENCYVLEVLFIFPSTDFSTSLGRFSRNFATRRGMC